MRPVVLCFSGLDPSGGAGLQADIETLAAFGAHAAVVCTALTIQDSQQVYGFETVRADLLQAQAEKILADLPVKAIKCGMLGSVETIAVIEGIARAHPHIPLVLDPVLAANSGGGLTAGDFSAQIHGLFKLATVITPNTIEAQCLSLYELPHQEAELIADLTQQGAKAILLKGGHESGVMLRNRLYQHGKLSQSSQWPRLQSEFHGSGCTLASAIAAGLAQGLTLGVAITRAEVWLHEALKNADKPHADGQSIPYRRAFCRGKRFFAPTDLNPKNTGMTRGLYLITDSSLDTAQLLLVVEAALKGQTKIIQYRDKSTDTQKRLSEANALKHLCDAYNAILIINDDVELAATVGAGVHLGRGDGSIAAARQRLGANAIIGATCHNSLEFAKQAAQEGADYLAFGAFYPSSTKPNAALADVAILQSAQQFGLPLVAIGGITLENATPIIKAGAHCVAVVNDICALPVANISQRAQVYHDLFTAQAS